jgi:hypothetical protein
VARGEDGWMFKLFSSHLDLPDCRSHISDAGRTPARCPLTPEEPQFRHSYPR